MLEVCSQGPEGCFQGLEFRTPEVAHIIVKRYGRKEKWNLTRDRKNSKLNGQEITPGHKTIFHVLLFFTLYLCLFCGLSFFFSKFNNFA